MWIVPQWLWAQPPGVLVWISEAQGPQYEVAQALQHHLSNVADVTVRLIEWGAVPEGIPAQAHIHIVLGARTLRTWGAAQSNWAWPYRDAPALAALVPRQSADAMWNQLSAGSSAIWLDQSPERFARLIRKAFPQAQRVGVLQGMQSAAALDRLTPVLQAYQLSVVRSPLVTDPQRLFSALSAVLPQVDVMLAQPDSVLFNSETLQNVLITAYRQRVPLVGFAESHVRAGATVGLYTQPMDLVTQILSSIEQWRVMGHLPKPAWSSTVRVAANHQVARSLGLDLPSAAELESWVSGGQR